MLRNTRKGFTLIELLIVVVIIGILAAIAIPKFANTKDKAKVSGMKTDLRNLVSAQEGFLADHNTYASGVAAVGTATDVAFVESQGNTVTITSSDASGWGATIARNPNDLATATTCGVFVGDAATHAPNAAVTTEGAVVCW